MKKDSQKKSHYDVLGVNKNASEDEIKGAYRQQAKANHTDKGGDHEKMTQITRAYSILKDPKKRKFYDETGQDEDRSASFEERFMAFVSQVFVQIIADCQDIEHQDMVKLFRDYMKEIIKQNVDNSLAIDKDLKKMTKVYERLSSKKENLIGAVLKGQIDGLRQKYNNSEDNVKFLKEANEVLTHYNYKWEPKVQDDISSDSIFEILMKNGSGGFTSRFGR